MRIRSFRSVDTAAVHRLCVATGDGGEPADRILRDPDLVAYVFADPYLLLQPELAFVAESEGRVLGYVVAALSSVEFYARWQLEWAPRFAVSHPASMRTNPLDADEQLRQFLHHPRRMLFTELDDFPSHLHINVTAHARGRGLGRGLLDAVFTELARAGSPGVQLGVRPSNAPALAFYRAVGMAQLAAGSDPGVRFGRPLNGWQWPVRDNGRTHRRHVRSAQ